jgi:Zn-dependent protease/predicted transcriptional regulator
VRRGFRLARLFGVDILVDGSLLILVFLLAWSLTVDFGDRYPELTTGVRFLYAATTSILFLGSVLIHELSHSVVALRRGLDVLQIRLFIFGGVSEIRDDARGPGEEFAIAAAGPLASLILGALLAALGYVVVGPWGRVFGLLGVANVILAGFNLLPGLPLDGGRLLHAALWRWRGDSRAATRIAVGSGRILGLVLAGIGILMFFTGAVFAGLWAMAVGWFMYQAAMGAKARADFVAKIGGVRVGDVMRPVAAAVDGDMAVTEVVALFGFGPRLPSLPVEVDGRVRGLVGDREIGSLSAEERATRSAAEVMTTIGPADVVAADTALETFFAREAGATMRAVVVADGRVVGVVTAREVAHLFG